MKVASRGLALLAGTLSAATLLLLWLGTEAAHEARARIKQAVIRQLVDVRPLPLDTVADAAYVLGGGQRSLALKFQAVAQLYRMGAVEKIWILGRRGITEYSAQEGRNLTNNEWSLRELKQLGVPEQCVEVIEVREGWFGTLSEAKEIARLAERRKLTTLVLIAQTHHTRRVRNSFSVFLPRHVSLYVQDLSDVERLHETVAEYVKLKAYDWFILP